MNKRKETLDIITLMVSMIAGVIGYVVSGLVYSVARTFLPSFLAIAIEFLVFFIILGMMMTLWSVINGNLRAHLRAHHDGGKLFMAVLVCVAATFVLGGLFEFIYELTPSIKSPISTEPTSYIFIIDDSGSMSSSDPNGLRYSAITTIMNRKDDSFPYAVYSFNNNVNLLREMAPKSEGINTFAGSDYGGTYIKKSLEVVMEDVKNGTLTNLGDRPKFLLLSDGFASDIGLISSPNRILKKYAKNNYTISTVGLGSADDSLMQKIADKTGGIYVSVDQVADLETGMQQAITSVSDNMQRTLFTVRNVPSLDLLYAIMRIVFTAILGFITSVAMLYCTGKGDDDVLIFKASIIKSIIAGLLLEVGINTIGMLPALVHFIYCVIVAMMFITTRPKYYTGKSSVGNLDFESMGKTSNRTSTKQLKDDKHSSFDDDFKSFL